MIREIEKKCYNLKLKVKSKKESCIKIRQENSMKFQVWNVYLIYTWLIVCTKLNLAYSKEYVYYTLLTCDMISLFQNLLCFSIIYDYMTMTYDSYIW